jgi:hypothetical protein
MKEYDFTLKFQLCNSGNNLDNYIEKLGAEGCDDALIGVGEKERITLNFIREDSSEHEAVNSAISNVKRAIPEASLVRENATAKSTNERERRKYY